MNAPLDGLRIYYFGHYDPEYSRNRIIQKALRRTGADKLAPARARTRRFLQEM